MRAQPVYILSPMQHRHLHLVKLSRTNLRAGPGVISSWPDFLCCFPCWLEFRSGFGRVAAAQLDTLFSVLPESCRQFRRSHCWRCSCRCHFLELASAPRSRRFFSMACSRLFETPRPVCRTFHAHCASLQLRSD